MLLYLVIWLYMWDDEVDQPEGAYANNLEKAEEYRSSTSSFISQCLQSRDHPSPPTLPSCHRIVDSFRDIGRPLAEFYETGSSTWPRCRLLLTVAKLNFNESLTKWVFS